MKKIILSLFIISTVNADVYLNESLLPDFRLVIDPILFTDTTGASCLFEAGRQNYRANGTIGYDFEDYRIKFSGEYLSQKLGFSFASGREHHWVQQGAVGAALQFYPAECGFHYSHSGSKRLSSAIVPRQNLICDKQIVGSNGFCLYGGSEISPWDSGIISGKIVYDYLRFNKTVQGFGVNLALDQYFECAKIHLGLEWGAPYISYDARVTTKFYFLDYPFDFAVYGRRVHGQKSIPNSSRIGIEITLNFDGLCSYENACDSFSSWLSRPAVYIPQVLVMKEQKVREFGQAPIGNLPTIFNFNSETIDLDLQQYFAGTSPLIYETFFLPPGITLNPATGKISGTIAPGIYNVVIKATNYFGNYSQLVVWNYQE